MSVKERDHRPISHLYVNGQVRTKMIWGLILERRCEVLCRYQSTVDGDALFGPVARRSSPLQSLRPGQVHEVKLSCQCLVLVHLRVPVRHAVVPFVLLVVLQQTIGLVYVRSGVVWLNQTVWDTYVFVGADPDLTEVDGENGMGPGALDVHLSAGRGPRESAQLQTLDHLQTSSWGQKQNTSHLRSQLD